MATKAYVEYDPTKHGDFRTSRYHGICKWCGIRYATGDKVNWNPRNEGTCCHAGCYKTYGSPTIYTSDIMRDILERKAEKAEGKTPEVIPAITSQEISQPVFIPSPNAPKSEPIAEKATSNDLQATIANAIIPYLEGRLKGLVTEAQVSEILDKVLDGRAIRTVTMITIEQETEHGFETRDLGVQHKSFTKLLKAVQARVNVWLTGPAGTGKTTAAENVAKALGLDFHFTGSIDTEYKLLGFVDAQGKIVNTAFRKAFTEGGLFLFDEVDSSLPAALLAFNAALANPYCAFPDGVLPRHKNFVAIAAANTWGLGATNDYVGRVKLDAAFLDRFQAKIHWGIDEELEITISGNPQWAKRVQRFRSVVTSKAIKGIMITPRASIGGAKLLAVGFPQNEVEELTMRSGMTDAQWSDVVSTVGVN